MNILNRLTIKHLKLNKRRTIVSIIGIVLSTAMMVGVGLLVSSIRDALIRDEELNNGSYHAIIENFDGANVDRINSNKNVKEVEYYSQLGAALFKESDNIGKPYYYVFAGDDAYLSHLEITEGRLPENETEIVISNHVFDQGTPTYQIGDKITLEVGTRMLDGYEQPWKNFYDDTETLANTTKQEYTIVGFCNRSYLESYSSPGFYVFTKLTSPSSMSHLSVMLTYKNPKDTYDLTEMFAQNVGKDLNDVNSQNDIYYHTGLLSLYGTTQYSNINNFLGVFLVIFLTILSVACIIVIYNSFAISVMERKKQFGLLSSVGATKKQIRRTVFYEATIVGIIGVILGLISAYIGIGIVIMIINHLLSGILSESLTFTLTTYPLFVVIPILFIIAVIYISAWIPAKQASKISPIEVIRQNDDIKLNKKKIKTSKLVTKIFGVEGELALKNIKRNRKKYRITIISLFISIVTFIAFYTYLDYGVSTVDSYTATLNFDLIVSTYQLEDAELSVINTAIQDEHVTDYLTTKSMMLLVSPDAPKEIIAEEDSSDYIADSIKVIELDQATYDEYRQKLGIKDERPILYNYINTLEYSDGNRFVTNKKYYQENSDLSLELVRITESDELEKYTTLENFHFTDKLPEMLENYITSPTVFVSESEFNRIWNLEDGQVSFVYEAMINGDDLDSIDTYLKDKSNSVDIYYINYVAQMRDSKNMVLAIEILFYGLLTLVTLIGVTSVFNTITTSINLRKKEFAVLRSVGLSPKGFNKMIWFESIFFGLKSLLYGLPVGILASYLISRNMGMLVENSFHLPIPAIIISCFGVFVVVMISIWYQASKVKKENIIDTIRNENI